MASFNDIGHIPYSLLKFDTASSRLMTLPLKAETSVHYGLMGVHFETLATGGGGTSGAVLFFASNPMEAITEILDADTIRYERGCDNCRRTPLIASGLYQPGKGKPGLVVEWFAEDPTQVPSTPCSIYSIRSRMTFMASQTCAFRFAQNRWQDGHQFVRRLSPEDKRYTMLQHAIC
ncbi:hypothetical protein FSARC_1964 [Fusarium sarcochroum]|uniref:Uncharacterized protein n=1 Tax=Fusarium sarcochroum TaxID=1208366 RepID=A0A8H4XEC6_9HYPO|nr:hypothetical protein FSARC_1964 [Fusarium sarcochroum]